MWDYIFETGRPRLEIELPELERVEFSRSEFGQSRPYHVHREHHLMFCVSGRAFLRLNDVEVEMTPGKLALIKADTLHSCGPKEEGLEFWGIAFRSSGDRDRLSRFFAECPVPTADFSGHMEYVRGAFTYFHELAMELSDREHWSAEDRREVDLVIYSQAQALIVLARNMFAGHPYREKAPGGMPMESVMRWLMEHYAEDITLDALSGRFAMSASHFSRRFYETFHVSPINYLIDYRMDAAKNLLIFTDKPIKEIAGEVGYANPYHFINLFTRRIGTSPAKLRSLCRNERTQPGRAVFRSETPMPSAAVGREEGPHQQGSQHAPQGDPVEGH